MFNIDIEQSENELNEIICNLHKEKPNVKVIFEEGNYNLSASSCCENYKSSIKEKFSEICKQAAVNYANERFSNLWK
jgi:hypothetical protein